MHSSCIVTRFATSIIKKTLGMKLKDFNTKVLELQEVHDDINRVVVRRVGCNMYMSIGLNSVTFGLRSVKKVSYKKGHIVIFLTHGNFIAIGNSNLYVLL